MISVRRATIEDRPRILEISSKIWDGDDYVPELLDEWFSDHAGELAVAAWDNLVIGFAHRTWLSPGISWFEGIRTDPAWQGHGAAKAITEHFIRGARMDGATRINLSTYIENEASIHIIESYGFSRVATFSYVERLAEAPSLLPAEMPAEIRLLSAPETLSFVDTSHFLSLAHRRFPRGWRFFPFDHDPGEAIARLQFCVGLWVEGVLTAALCIRQAPQHTGRVTVNFLDGEPENARCLLAYAMSQFEGRSFEMMVPVDQGRHALPLDFLREVGFTSWSGFKP
ncbi:GNAT family N-acetyltransferase, partial [Candidatus Bipolaricaulota bacterium]|nr:GNAT family N-acetyltransferase [Candidatus Bipolaricaulota bacterium]